MSNHIPPTLGVLLAGGLARRMGGGDKPLTAVGGRSMLDRAIAVLHPQCAGLIVSANGDPSRFAATGLPVVADDVPDFAGPLAGILAALDWAAENRPDVDWVLSVAGDSPFLPPDLVQSLHRERKAAGAQLAQAESGGRTHPVNALWPVCLRLELRRALVEENLRKVGAWMDRHALVTVSWPVDPVDPFFNANTPEDVIEAERLARLHGR